jgi:type I restriction enzyme S subunit
MRSHYKKLGRYVQQVNKRNKDMAVMNLQGININKLFMPSVANTIGVDLSQYKIVSKYQFAFNPMHVGRDEMLPISMLEKDESVIVSPAYVVFEIKDHNELDPEYLMMWCRRPEFDRNAWFTTDSSVRGGFSWSDFCEMELPVPSVQKQREIVREYNVIVDRIRLNEQLNQKLEETAQAIYKHWFVDFEFPISAEYAASVGNPDLEGKPYKSSGGEMIFCKELEQEIPRGWECDVLEKIIDLHDAKRIPLSSFERVNMQKIYPYYGAASLMDYVENYIFDGEYILLGEDGTVVSNRGTPVLQHVWGKFWVNNHAHILTARGGYSLNTLYQLLMNTNITDAITGGVQAKISQSNLKKVRILYPNKDVLLKFDKINSRIFLKKRSCVDLLKLLNKISEILLSSLANKSYYEGKTP